MWPTCILVNNGAPPCVPICSTMCTPGFLPVDCPCTCIENPCSVSLCTYPDIWPRRWHLKTLNALSIVLKGPTGCDKLTIVRLFQVGLQPRTRSMTFIGKPSLQRKGGIYYWNCMFVCPRAYLKSYWSDCYGIVFIQYYRVYTSGSVLLEEYQDFRIQHCFKLG